jgi:lipopolysaccharide transport system permease protein
MPRKAQGPGHLEGLALIYRYRHLAIELARREITDRYAGSHFGIFWAVFQPLALMGVLALVFNYAFQIRFGDTSDMPLDFTSYMISGYLPWMAMVGGMLGSASSVHANAALVKQMEFPLAILPVKATLAALSAQVVGTIGIVLYIALRFETASPLLPLILPAIGLQLLLTMGLGWCFAAIGAFFRDLNEVLQTLFMINLYMMPVVFAPQWTPKILQPIILLNPFSHVVFTFQDILYYGSIAHPLSWGVFVCLAALAFSVGFRFFQRMKSGFGNVV